MPSRVPLRHPDPSESREHGTSLLTRQPEPKLLRSEGVGDEHGVNIRCSPCGDGDQWHPRALRPEMDDEECTCEETLTDPRVKALLDGLESGIIPPAMGSHPLSWLAGYVPPEVSGTKRWLMPLEVIWPDHILTTDVEVPGFIEIEVALDSGAGVHVASKLHVPGYTIQESILSKAGGGFVAADGNRIDNLGEVELHLETPDGQGRHRAITSTFQVADVTRPLWSVGVCDHGLGVKFSSKSASVVDSRGVEICHFERRNGLYLAKVKMRNPLHKSFIRQG